MSNKEFYDLLMEYLQPQEVLVDEPMSKHTSFKIGGPADFFIIPANIEQLKKAISICHHNGMPFYVIGNGSNLLVRDKGYRGAVIQVYKQMDAITIEGEKVTAEAGVLLSKLAKRICDASLTGFEFASGIPGTLGGALYMNAGAYGGEMKGIVESAQVVDLQGNVWVLSNEELQLGYRTSILQSKNYIVLSVTLKLKKGDQGAIKKQMDDLTLQRNTKQPVELPSAGSTFKRPEGYFAGKLIMDSELRGFRVGGAQVSEKHCGFVVNIGNATAEDVLGLIAHVQNTVREKFGVTLEPEIRIIGE